MNRREPPGAAPRPIEPVSNSPGEPIPVPGQVPESPAAVPQNIVEPKPLPVNPGAAASSAAGITQPGDALASGENAAPHDKSTRKPDEALSRQTDSGAQPVSPAARAGGNTVTPPGEQALPRAAGSGNEAGWISIPNSGKVPVDLTERPVGEPGAAGPDNGAAPLSTAGDSRFHASRDINFEPEPTQSRRFDAGSSESSGAVRGSGATAASNQQPRAASHSERVDATEHVVELKENYWTISAQYWGSGRYFAALWKANAAKYPDIERLHVGDVIVVPAIEDLDPDYILPRGKTVTPEWLANLGISRRASPSKRASGDAGSDEEAAPARSATASASGKVGLASARSGNVATRRATQSDSELDLPASGSGSRVDRSSPYKGRSSAAASTFDGDGAGEETESRTAARPRATKASSASSPVYKVRSNDTLRSIARDTLGDARRADEILELNRGAIDDPAQLVVGQVLELPEDARTGIRRRSSR
jgi:nucleoid-associated protein YgaU